jgi:hypothetical protein
MNKGLDLLYFDELTTRLNLYQGVLKVVSGVVENTEMIVEYQPEVNTYPCYTNNG